MLSLLKKSNYYLISIIFLLWASLLLMISQVYFCSFGIRECLSLMSFANWDGEHFLRIINQGYIYDFSFAFFPLFPFLVKSVGFILPFSSVVIGLLLNFVFTWMGLIYLYRLLVMTLDKKAALWIVILMLCFPISFFFLMFYSEALFFLLSVLSIYFYRRKKYWWVVFLLLLLTLTRMAGLALVMSILIDVWNKKELRSMFLLPFLGVSSFIFGSYIKTGNVFAVVRAEISWERIITLPGFSIFNSIAVLFREGISYQNFSLVSELFLVCIVVVLLFRSRKLLPGMYWNYTFFSLLIPLSTSTFLSFPRFLIVLFPLFVAFYLSSNTMVRVVYAACGSLFLLMLFILFLQGGWVA